MSEPPQKGAFPIEIMLSIFSHLDGPMLCVCRQVCHAWKSAIDHYDDLIWPQACARLVLDQRFRSLAFPSRPSHLTHQDMYRITWNWYRGHCRAYYPTTTTAPLDGKEACLVVGSVQEQGMFTSLTISNDHRIIRSNPTYSQSGAQRLVIQSPMPPFTRFFLEENWIPENADPGLRTIVCHYSHPDSKYLATGSLNGTVSVWDMEQKKLVRVWHGHRGRVLCISMNDQVVVSGGSDNIIRVWDLDDEKKTAPSSTTDDQWVHHHRQTRRRGMIEVSKYLSSEEWYQGVGEIAVNGNLIACAPDASSGPILVFSLLTGSRVYELKERASEQLSEWISEEMTGLSCLCLTPFFLLTKGKVINDHHQNIKLVPSEHNVVLQRTQKEKTEQSLGYVSRLSESSVEMPSSQMTPYQLYQYYSQQEEQQAAQKPSIPATSACINVWDLQNGKLIYRLVPTLQHPNQYYTIADIKVSPDYARVFCSIDVRENQEYHEYLYCWDFSIHSKNQSQEQQKMGFVELDTLVPATRTCGKSWVCFM
ncbi:WD40 repeat-like protein [Backusella circina FSU 941]|nr:WD40 repeat-like protein [Backusella circina FSU 941]